eukprot:2078240-Rhodomonas_salina.1
MEGGVRTLCSQGADAGTHRLSSVPVGSLLVDIAVFIFQKCVGTDHESRKGVELGSVVRKSTVTDLCRRLPTASSLNLNALHGHMSVSADMP